MDDSESRTMRKLRLIADTLKVPVEQFYNPASSDLSAELSKVLQRWYALDTDLERDAALDCFRRAVDKVKD